MTIAACYVSPEGVVLGADSTTTNYVPHPSQSTGETHHFNYGQKIFEVGEGSSIGIATYGLGSFLTTSYRTLIARLGDEMAKSTPVDMIDVAWRWSNLFFEAYSVAFGTHRVRLNELLAKGDSLGDSEKKEKEELKRLNAGFCIGGHTAKRSPEAFHVYFALEANSPPQPEQIQMGFPRFWGWSNLLSRLNYGLDDTLFDAIMSSGKWSGTQEELIQIAIDNRITPPIDLPLRDAIDWMYSSIYTTIKAIKFSHFSPYCGGPIELATITTDRRFRWVCHKSLNAAIDY